MTTPLADDARHLSRYPIVRRPAGFGCRIELQDWRGKRVSIHRTVTGALRRRAELIEEETLYAEAD
jgi:hypothetical protein